MYDVYAREIFAAASQALGFNVQPPPILPEWQPPPSRSPAALATALSWDLGYADALGIADPGTRLWAMNATKAVEGIYLAAAKPAER